MHYKFCIAYQICFNKNDMQDITAKKNTNLNKQQTLSITNHLYNIEQF